jgi:hypothetical protein
MDLLDQLKLDADLKKKSPFASWQMVEVTFPPVPYVDLDIPYQLETSDPTQVGFLVLRQSSPAGVWKSPSQANTSQYIRLRSTVGGLRATLLLFVPRASFSPGNQDYSGVNYATYTPTLATDNGATITPSVSSGAYVVDGNLVHLELEAVFAMSVANGNNVFASIPSGQVCTKNTMVGIPIYQSGVGFVSSGAAQIQNTTSTVILTNIGGTWGSGNTYVCWCQLNYLI